MKKLIFLAALCTFSCFAKAGMVEGPLVVWFNMSNNPKSIDARIKKYLTSGEANKLCWNDAATMYIDSKPPGITRDLIRSAIYQKNQNSIKSLNKILKTPFMDAGDGFDGIVVYSDEHGLKYYSLTTGKKKIKSLDIDPKDVEVGMCVVLPDIVRKP